MKKVALMISVLVSIDRLVFSKNYGFSDINPIITQNFIANTSALFHLRNHKSKRCLLTLRLHLKKMTSTNT